VGEAEQHLTTALSLLPEVPAPARPSFLLLSQVRGDLKRLSQPGRNPFAPQPPSRLHTLWTLWRASRSREFTK
jgi:phytoene synthase